MYRPMSVPAKLPDRPRNRTRQPLGRHNASHTSAPQHVLPAVPEELQADLAALKLSRTASSERTDNGTTKNTHLVPVGAQQSVSSQNATQPETCAQQQSARLRTTGDTVLSDGSLENQAPLQQRRPSNMRAHARESSLQQLQAAIRQYVAGHAVMPSVTGDAAGNMVHHALCDASNGGLELVSQTLRRCWQNIGDDQAIDQGLDSCSSILGAILFLLSQWQLSVALLSSCAFCLEQSKQTGKACR